MDTIRINKNLKNDVENKETIKTIAYYTPQTLHRNENEGNQRKLQVVEEVCGIMSTTIEMAM